MSQAKRYSFVSTAVGLGLAVAVSAQTPDFVVAINDTAQPVLGFGAQVWTGDTVG